MLPPALMVPVKSLAQTGLTSVAVCAVVPVAAIARVLSTDVHRHLSD